MQLDFFERHTVNTSGYGETEVEEVVTVNLNQAWYGTNGLRGTAVVNPNRYLSGFVRIPSNILHPGTVYWEVQPD
jgi:hypothetical protein